MALTIAEHMEQLRKLSAFASAQAVQAIIVPRANELLANTKNRIIKQGLDSNMSAIGPYSKKPGYYGRGEFINGGAFVGQGKSGFKGERIKRDIYNVVVQKNGRERLVLSDEVSIEKRTPKNMYLEQGYYQFRQIQGREVGFTNLVLSGDTMQRYQMSVQGGSILFGMTTRKAALIRQGQEERKDKPIFKSSKQEIEEYNKQVVEDFKHLNTELLAG